MSAKSAPKKRKLVRPKKGRVIAGVAAGMANYFDTDVALVRFIWLLLLFVPILPGIIPYLLFWILMPEEE